MASKSASPAVTQLLDEAGFPLIPNHWEILRIEELLRDDRGISVGVMYPGDHDPSGIPLIKAGDLAGSRINPQPEFRITREKHREYRRTELEGGEVLISLVGDVGRCAVVPPQMAGWNAARAIAVLRLTTPSNAAFLRFCLLSKPLQYLMQAWSTTTVQATLNLKEIRQLPIPWPPTKERDAITHILGTLDDKIELNRRQNETLEAMARALFKSWFVDFDPVRAKAEGRETGLPGHIADLFPNVFEGSMLGAIPKGWSVGSVDDDFNLTMGQSPSGETYNEVGLGLPFYQGRTDFGFRFPTRRIYCTAPTRLGNPGDTLVSVRAPVGDLNIATEECAIGRGVAAVRHKTGSRSYSYHFMHSIEDVFARFEGEGTIFGSIGKKDFHSITCVNPPREIVLAYEVSASSLDDRIEVNERESRALSTLRDTLLPKLISGELQVRNAEKIIGGA